MFHPLNDEPDAPRSADVAEFCGQQIVRCHQRPSRSVGPRRRRRAVQLRRDHPVQARRDEVPRRCPGQGAQSPDHARRRPATASEAAKCRCPQGCRHLNRSLSKRALDFARTRGIALGIPTFVAIHLEGTESGSTRMGSISYKDAEWFAGTILWCGRIDHALVGSRLAVRKTLSLLAAAREPKWTGCRPPGADGRQLADRGTRLNDDLSHARMSSRRSRRSDFPGWMGGLRL